MHEINKTVIKYNFKKTGEGERGRRGGKREARGKEGGEGERGRRGGKREGVLKVRNAGSLICY